jgi:hypothetical protein
VDRWTDIYRLDRKTGGGERLRENGGRRQINVLKEDDCVRDRYTGSEEERRKRQKGERGKRKKRDIGQKNINTDDYVDKRKVNRLRA